MNTTQVKLTQVAVNQANPRTITDNRFKKLVDSILIFPKMLSIRPVVVDNTMTALGGNMRYRALCAIADMSDAEIVQRLCNTIGYGKRTNAEREALLDYWHKWLDAPVVDIIKASDLTSEECREFIIKDNTDSGEWDDSSWVINGKRFHGRVISDIIKRKGGLKGLSRAEFIHNYIDANASPYITRGKRKYLMAMDKKMRKQILPLSQPYPKNKDWVKIERSIFKNHEQAES